MTVPLRVLFLGVNRALKVLSDCNQALVRAPEESELLNDICRIIVENGGYQMAWVCYAEQDEMKTVRPVARGGACHTTLTCPPVADSTAARQEQISSREERCGRKGGV